MFDDYLSDGRTPGVIGILIGMVVIVGFGTLAGMSNNELNLGKEETRLPIDKRLQELENQVARQKQRKMQMQDELAAAEQRAAVVRQLHRLERELETKVTLRAELDQSVRCQEAIVANAEEKILCYRNELRSSARGEQLGSFETLSKKAYEGARINEVTDIGVSLRHANGVARVPYADLPEEWKRRFRYKWDEQAAASQREKDSAAQFEKAILDAKRGNKPRRR